MDGVGSVTMADQDAAEPLVVKYLPELPVCEGKAFTAPQDDVLPSVVKYLPELPVWLGTTYTELVLRDTVTAPVVPPPDNPVPAVTDSMSPLVAITDQAEPVHTYIPARAELK